MNDVLYLETDEEITTAIDKMLSLKGDSVSIVVPKRSALIQSIVNLKLLKKAADDAGKELVLVTGDKTATHLAAKVGLAVAATLKSAPVKPEIKTSEPDDTSEIVEGETEPDEVSQVGSEEAGDTKEPEELKDEEAAALAAAAAGMAAHTSKKPDFAKPMTVRRVGEDEAVAEPVVTGGGKKIKVPDFNALQKRALLIGGAIVLVVVLFALQYFLETANVTIFAKGAKIATSFDFTADPNLHQSNLANATLAAQKLTSSKTLTQSVTPTGQQDVGTKASGSITVTNNCYNPGSLPAGTVFISGGGLKFASTTSVAVPDAVGHKGVCSATTAAVPVTATANGDQYNLPSGTSYTISGYSSSDMSGTGNGAMTGGTSKIVKVVTQQDVDQAAQQMLANDKDGSQKDLESKASSDLVVLPPSFAQTAGTATASPGVGQQADSTTVSVPVTYTELAVNKNEFQQLAQSQEQSSVGSQNQIYDDGVSSGNFSVGTGDATGAQDFHFSTNAYAGAKIDTVQLAKQLAGKKYGDAADFLAKQPGVDRAEISLAPAWSSRMPSIVSHIKIQVKVIPASG